MIVSDPQRRTRSCRRWSCSSVFDETDDKTPCRSAASRAAIGCTGGQCARRSVRRRRRRASRALGPRRGGSGSGWWTSAGPRWPSFRTINTPSWVNRSESVLSAASSCPGSSATRELSAPVAHQSHPGVLPPHRYPCHSLGLTGLRPDTPFSPFQRSARKLRADQEF